MNISFSSGSQMQGGVCEVGRRRRTGLEMLQDRKLQLTSSLATSVPNNAAFAQMFSSRCMNLLAGHSLSPSEA